MDINTKQCTKCGIIKSLHEFSKQKTGKYGHRAECKLCSKDRHHLNYINNKQKYNARSKQYKIKHGLIKNKKPGEIGHNTKYCLKDVINAAKQRNITVLSDTYVDARHPMQFLCNKCGYKWQSSFCKMRKLTQCAKCNGKVYKVTIQNVNSTAIERGGVCLSKQYVNNRTKMWWQCKQGHKWQAVYNAVQSGSWCPTCAAENMRVTETRCRTIFEDHFNKLFPSTRPSFLKNPQTGWNLELDGYCEELQLAFEYDGEQHYGQTFLNINKKDLEAIRHNDKLKDKLCKINGVTLIRIPYWEKNSLKRYILTMINKVKL